MTIWDTLARCILCHMLTYVNDVGICLRCARNR